MDPLFKCEFLRHSWDDIPVTSRPSFGTGMWFRCMNCGSERHDIINRFNGELLSRSYVYSDQYRQRMNRGSGRVPVEDKRLEYLRQVRKDEKAKRDAG